MPKLLKRNHFFLLHGFQPPGRFPAHQHTACLFLVEA